MEAKDVKDRLPDKGETIVIEIENESLAQEILKIALSLKVKARVD